MNLREKLFPKTREFYRIHHEDEHANEKFLNYLETLIPEKKQPIVIVSIGSDRSTGDALGPLVGSRLKDKLPELFVYGTLESPVHAVNLKENLHTIKQTFNDPFIIGIDACLGQLSSIGVITIADGPVSPGAAVNKQLPPVGDIHITGIVNVGGFMEYFVLQNTRLHLVMSMANFIADGLFSFLAERRNLNSQQSQSV